MALVSCRRLSTCRGLSQQLDLSEFDAKAPPPKTAAFWEIVNANTAPEDIDLANLLDQMGNPDALTPKQMLVMANGDMTDWMIKNRRSIPHQLERCGYSPVHNETAKDGKWLVDGERQPVYCKTTLSAKQRHTAVHKLRGEPQAPPTGGST